MDAPPRVPADREKALVVRDLGGLEDWEVRRQARPCRRPGRVPGALALDRVLDLVPEARDLAQVVRRVPDSDQAQVLSDSDSPYGLSFFVGKRVRFWKITFDHGTMNSNNSGTFHLV